MEYTMSIQVTMSDLDTRKWFADLEDRVGDYFIDNLAANANRWHGYTSSIDIDHDNQTAYVRADFEFDIEPLIEALLEDVTTDDAVESLMAYLARRASADWSLNPLYEFVKKSDERREIQLDEFSGDQLSFVISGSR